MDKAILLIQYLFSGLFFSVIGYGNKENEIGAVAGFVFGIVIMRLIELQKIHYKVQINKISNEEMLHHLAKMFRDFKS